MTLSHSLLAKEALVGWDEVWECYTWSSPKTNLTGITKLLKKRFYPRVKKAKAKGKPDREPKGSKRFLKGIKGGKLVHEQLAEFVKLSRQAGGLCFFEKKHKDVDPRVLSIVREVISRGWSILRAEYIVADKALKIATGVDLLCLDQDGKAAIIEIKTGYENCYVGVSQSAMKSPLNDMDRSPYSQHQVQLLVTSELFKRFTGIDAAHCEVWLVNPPKRGGSSAPPKVFPLHPAIISRGTDVINSMLQKRPKKDK